MSTHDASASCVPPLGQRTQHLETHAEPARPLSIGIVVPVFNEAAILSGALERLRQVAGTLPVVVAEGGSTDGSAHIARQFFPTEICSQANRGAQLNRGAQCLCTDVLLFLHADSQLPADFEFYIRQALRDPRVVGGCFRLRFDASRPMLRFYCWFTQFSGRFFHFGDQGFFVRRQVFQHMGGFRSLAFLEDVDFLRRLRRYGRFAVLPVPVVTSARRFLRHGVMRQQLRNILLVTLFELGVSPQRLTRLYPHSR
jgi:rSAM/selenodomain-associated transferase 2